MHDAIAHLEKGGYHAAADLLRNEMLQANDRHHLSELKEDLGTADRLYQANPRCRIWSEERQAWWRANASGYSTVKGEAGVYLFGDAWRRSSHCDSTKGIVYEIIDEGK